VNAVFQVDSHTLKLEKENAVAMTEGFLKNGERHHVSIFTASEESVALKVGDFRHHPKLLTPKKAPPKKIFPLSLIGMSLDVRYCDYDSKANYVAFIDTIFHIKHDIRIWNELCNNGVFDIWDPKAPYNMLTHDAKNMPVERKDPMILLLRIFKINDNFRGNIKQRQFWNIITPRKVNLIGPVISNVRFEEIKAKIRHTLNNILGNRGYREIQWNDTNLLITLDESNVEDFEAISSTKGKQTSLEEEAKASDETNLKGIIIQIDELPQEEQEKLIKTLSDKQIEKQRHRYHLEKTIKPYIIDNVLPTIQKLCAQRSINIEQDIITITIEKGIPKLDIKP
jgi:hypothetical protein